MQKSRKKYLMRLLEEVNDVLLDEAYDSIPDFEAEKRKTCLDLADATAFLWRRVKEA